MKYYEVIEIENFQHHGVKCFVISFGLWASKDIGKFFPFTFDEIENIFFRNYSKSYSSLSDF